MRPRLAPALLLATAVAVPAAPPPEATGRLRGEVRTPALKPVAGAMAVAARGEAPPVVALTATDSQGFLAVDGVPAGTWTVRVTAPGFLPAEVGHLTIGGPYRSVADVTLKPGDGEPVALRLPETSGQAAVVVRATDDHGKPLSGVRLRLEPPHHRADPLIAETDSTGQARVETGAGGNWRIALSRAGWTHLIVPRVEWPGGELTILARLLPLPEGTPAPLDELLPVFPQLIVQPPPDSLRRLVVSLRHSLRPERLW